MNLKQLLGILPLACLLWACSDDDTPATTQPALTLELTSGVVKNHSAAVQATPSETESTYYLHLFTQGEYETAKANLTGTLRQLAEGDKKHCVQGGQTFIFDGLSPKQGYVACAVALGDNDEAQVATTTFVTTDQELPELQVNGVNLVNDGDDMGKQMTSFRLAVYNADASGGWWANGDVLQMSMLTEWLGLYVMPQSADFFQGIYKSGTGEEDAIGDIVNRNSTLYHYDEWASHPIEYAEVALSFVGGEQRFSGIFHTQDGLDYSFDFAKPCQFVQAGYYGYVGYKHQLDKDITGLDYTLMKEAYFMDQKDGVGRYTFAVVNDPDDTDIYGGFKKHCIRMTLYAPLPKYPLMEFPTGTYTLQEERAAFAAMPGDYARIGSYTYENQGTYYYWLNDETGIQIMGFLRTGQVTVSRQGNEYQFDIDAATHLGYKVSGTYRGPVTITTDPGL